MIGNALAAKTSPLWLLHFVHAELFDSIGVRLFGVRRFEIFSKIALDCDASNDFQSAARAVLGQECRTVAQLHPICHQIVDNYS